VLAKSLPLYNGGFDQTEAFASEWMVDLQQRKHRWWPEKRRRCLQVGDGL